MKKYDLILVGKNSLFNAEQKIIIQKEYHKALLHLDKFSHIIIFWLNNNRDKLYSQFKENKNIYTALNAKYNFCFNSIELTVARIKDVNYKEGIITINPSLIPAHAQVVDIKPYIPAADRVKNCQVPKELSALPLPDFFNEEELSKPVRQYSLTEKNKSLQINQQGTIYKKNGKCRIELANASPDFFNSLNNFSHLQVIWWFSRFEKDNYRRSTQCNPPYENAPRTGIFATRSPVRPNPIALDTVRMLKTDKDKKLLEISEIEAFDKTPVLDILPYIPCLDRVNKYMQPEWINHWNEWVREPANLPNNNRLTFSQSDYDRLKSFTGLNQKALSKKPVKGKISAKSSNNSEKYIIVKGARENNLKNISVKIPKNKITVITGLSGSGKSSLAFDIIYAESQRRFMDSISTSGRQLFKQFSKPAADRISNLPPAIAIEQKTLRRNQRSTVGTISDISDYLRLLYAKIGIRHCPQCGRAVQPKNIHEILNLLNSINPQTGYSLISLKDNKLISNHINKSHNSGNHQAILKKEIPDLIAEGKGAFKVKLDNNEEFILHTRNNCYYCNRSFFDLTPSFFSSNNPESMCPECNGLGTIISVSPDLVVSEPGKSILDSASPWWGNLREFIRKPSANWMRGEIFALANELNIDLEIPWKDLPDKFKEKALYGTGNKKVSVTYKNSNGRSGKIERPAEGAVNTIKRLFQTSQGKSSYDFYLQFMKTKKCPSCNGEKLSQEARSVTIAGKRFPEIMSLSIDMLDKRLKDLSSILNNDESLIAEEIINTLKNKTKSLIDVGLHYLSLDRSTPTLSGGEAQRIRLAAQLDCGLTNLLYILDEPSVGLHTSDHDRLINTIEELRDLGNTLIIVEHDKKIMLRADHIIDLGPGAGIRGGEIIASGTPEQIIKSKASVTGKYLKKNLLKKSSIQENTRQPKAWLKLTGANRNNLKDININLPLGTFICVTGKSGSGKSSLISQTLAPVLMHYCNHGVLIKGSYKKISGHTDIDNVISITQDAIGRSPRSNPATFTGVFDEIRKIFAKTADAKERNFGINNFSFNSPEGRCETCQGNGKKKIEMNLIADIWIPCSDCQGRRFKKETLEIKYKGKTIADILEMDIDYSLKFFSEEAKVIRILQTLQDVGLGYIKLGQNALTLSGGEAQRVKLARELSKSSTGKTIYILDEPTSGLHFADIKHLLELLHKITDAGNTVIVIEHNTDLIKNADWIIDLGPEGGDKGGHIIAEGTPEQIKKCPQSYTGLQL